MYAGFPTSYAPYLPPAVAAGLTAGVLNTGKPSTTVGAPEGTATTAVPGELPAAGEDPAGPLMTSIPGALATTVGVLTEPPEVKITVGAVRDPEGAATLTMVGFAEDGLVVGDWVAGLEAVTGLGSEGTVTVRMPGSRGVPPAADVDAAGLVAADADDADVDDVPLVPETPLTPDVGELGLPRLEDMFGKPCTGARLMLAECQQSTVVRDGLLPYESTRLTYKFQDIC